MGALTRVLSEEYKKSVELCYNILRAFLVRRKWRARGEEVGGVRVKNDGRRQRFSLTHVYAFTQS